MRGCGVNIAAHVQYDPDDDSSEYIAQQQAAGFVVRIPGPCELQIDLDTDAHYATHRRAMEIFDRKVIGAKVRETTSRSGKRHVHIELPFAIDPWQRIAWQAALGSDPVRELLSSVRVLNGDSAPTLFVETKEAAASLIDVDVEEIPF